MAEAAIEYDRVSAQAVIDDLNQSRQRAINGANHVAELARARMSVHFEQMTQQGAVANRLLEGPPLNPGAGK